MTRLSRSRRTLDTLLADAGIERDVASIDLLAIGWRGRGGGPYRDDDGTHARVLLGDGTSVVYREYATTTSWASKYRAKEAFVFAQLGKAGLPTPSVLASVDGTPGTGGDPPAMLLSDPGGEPLEALFRTAPTIWSEAGAMLRRLHDVDVSYAGFLADPGYGRPWTRFVPYFAKSLRENRRRHPHLAGGVDEMLALLREPVAAYLETRPRAICCAPYSMPGLMLERAGARWECRSWLSLGYYVSVGDPERDVVAIATRYRNQTGSEVPRSFFTGYGRRPDPVCELVYGAYHSARRLDELPETIERLRALLA